MTNFSFFHNFLEADLQSKLHGPRTVRVDRMQERCAGQAIRAALGLESSGVQRARVAVDDVVAGAAWIVGIVDAELGVVEDVEGFGAELRVNAFVQFEVLHQRHVEIEAAGIVQVVAACIAEGQAAGRVSDARVADGEALRHTEYQRRAGFERSGIGFVARSVLEKDSIAVVSIQPAQSFNHREH